MSQQNDDLHNLEFPADFTWGAATASYQIEGAVDEDGRGPSIWDTFSAQPGNITDGTSGAVADDHYHRFRDDVQLLKSLGVGAYRFSIAWPRILPSGMGQVNEKGLAFYDELVDELLKNGIEPYATLYHWDLPQAQHDKTTWADRGIVDAYLEYADIVSRALGDRVHNWMTFNEPWVTAWIGYREGRHAPGLHDTNMALRATHHLMLSHGLAVPILRANGDAGTRVGIVLNLNWVDAASNSDADRAAAYRQDGHQNRWFLDPIFRGEYPADMLAIYGAENVPVQPGDLDAIRAPIDFLGVNNYFRNVIADGDEDPMLRVTTVRPPGEYTEMNWEVHPDGLYNLLTRLARDYNPPALYVTENGAAFVDTLTNGEVHDPRRVAYLQAHIAAANRARQDGAPLRGYFVWSLMDNFEWGYGYSKRFGIVYVDYATQQRTVKDSGKMYAELIRRNTASSPR